METSFGIISMTFVAELEKKVKATINMSYKENTLNA